MKVKTYSRILLSSDTILFIFSYLCFQISKLLSFDLFVRRNYPRSVQNLPCLTNSVYVKEVRFYRRELIENMRTEYKWWK